MSQKAELTERYGKEPTLPVTDDRWEQLPQWMRTSMVLNISNKPAAADTPEERAEKLAALLNDGDYDSAHDMPTTADEAEVISSLDLETYKHRPVLDIDFPAELRPSTTPGHFHLYLDKPMTEYQYRRLIRVLSDVGIIELGYMEASLDRGYTSVRLPWVKKPAKESQEDTL